MPKKRKKKSQVLKKTLLFLIKIPYYLAKGIYKIGKVAEKKVEEEKIQKKREKMIAKYGSFKTLEMQKGSFDEWEKDFNFSDSKIGIILGARGTGKTAIGLKILENCFAKYKKKCFSMGFDESEMPSFVNNVERLEEIENDSVVLIDEGGILFSSRSSMSSANKLLSKLILIARHKNLSIIFISQNSSNLEVNVLRQADFLILKPSSLLQKDFERKIIQNLYKEQEKNFEKFKKDKGLTYFYSEEFKGFISNPLPSFWGKKISKSFR